MLDRLKSLPLTIILTILIWMYAESQVNSARSDISLTMSDIPVWVSGPPSVLSQYDVMVESKSIVISVTGSPNLIEALRNRNPGQSGIFAYLDITPEDRASPNLKYRSIRVVTPVGITVLQKPELVGFRLALKTPATAP